MAGYVMTLDSLESLERCINTGTYSTKLNEPNGGNWRRQQEGTFADYFSMKENDNIYFFIERKIYGIGKLVTIENECKYLNYIDADLPQNFTDKEYKERKPLLSYTTKVNRCFCIFMPEPFFFRNGIDMDEVLNSNPTRFRMLRALWKVSFVKIDDEENQALLDIILKRNEQYIFTGENTYPYNDEIHEVIRRNVSSKYQLNCNKMLSLCANRTLIKHEMAIEAALCEFLSKNNELIFGGWDYISHQVVASPFKAIDYMDKMDIFGYRNIEGYSTKSRYLVIEIKKDSATEEVVGQIMKYVDWVKSEYAHGDYSMIEAYVVAYDFSEEVIEKKNNECIRNFINGYRPTISCKWDFVKFVKYSYEYGELKFTLI